MFVDEIREYCITKPYVSESFPFDNTALVFKVHTKMFALLGLNSSFINLKCDPVRAIELRELHSCITPGYHMNKVHWNTIDLQNSLPDSLLKELIDHSYTLVFESFSKKIQNQLQQYIE